jgi:hypothetical protein
MFNIINSFLVFKPAAESLTRQLILTHQKIVKPSKKELPFQWTMAIYVPQNKFQLILFRQLVVNPNQGMNSMVYGNDDKRLEDLANFIFSSFENLHDNLFDSIVYLH